METGPESNPSKQEITDVEESFHNEFSELADHLDRIFASKGKTYIPGKNYRKFMKAYLSPDNLVSDSMNNFLIVYNKYKPSILKGKDGKWLYQGPITVLYDDSDVTFKNISIMLTSFYRDAIAISKKEDIFKNKTTGVNSGLTEEDLRPRKILLQLYKIFVLIVKDEKEKAILTNIINELESELKATDGDANPSNPLTNIMSAITSGLSNMKIPSAEGTSVPGVPPGGDMGSLLASAFKNPALENMAGSLMQQLGKAKTFEEGFKAFGSILNSPEIKNILPPGVDTSSVTPFLNNIASAVSSTFTENPSMADIKPPDTSTPGPVM